MLHIDGQAIAVKLCKQITQKTNAIKVAIAKYNTALAFWKDQVEGLPATIHFDEMKDPESPIYQHFRGAAHLQDEVPFALKRNIIELHNFVERCKEENEHLDVELMKLMVHYENQKAHMQSFIDAHVDEPTVYIRGLNSLLQKRIRESENKLYALGSLLSTFLPDNILSRIPNKECVFTSVEDHENDMEVEIVDVAGENSACETDDEDDVLSILDISDDDETL